MATFCFSLETRCRGFSQFERDGFIDWCFDDERRCRHPRRPRREEPKWRTSSHRVWRCLSMLWCRRTIEPPRPPTSQYSSPTIQHRQTASLARLSCRLSLLSLVPGSGWSSFRLAPIHAPRHVDFKWHIERRSPTQGFDSKRANHIAFVVGNFHHDFVVHL
jgi:hypothetical protein